MSRKDKQMERGGDGKVIWDMGSSLYDSYELASLSQILDRHLVAGQLSDGEPPQKGPTGVAAPSKRSSGQVVVFGAHRSRAAGSKKVTLRALFRAVASWAIKPRQAHACACVGVAPSGAVEPVVSLGKH